MPRRYETGRQAANAAQHITDSPAWRRRELAVMRWRLRLAALQETVRHWKWLAADRLKVARYGVLSAVLNRFATREMRHAALLLGYDLALGYGQEGLLLGPLLEFSTGNEIGYAVRHGTAGERAEAMEQFALERTLYQAPVKSGLHLTGGAR